MDAPSLSVSNMTEERREPAPLFAFELTEASAQPRDHWPDPHRLDIRPEVVLSRFGAAPLLA
jgi:hypothetical protein